MDCSDCGKADKGTQLAYQPFDMRHLLGILSIGMLALGGRDFFLHLKSKGKKRLAQSKLEVWEGEGGAVPASRRRTAAQITPRKRRRPSSRTDA